MIFTGLVTYVNVILITMLSSIGELFAHKYENAMTIQKTSWGYICNTNITGYLTIEELLYKLVTTVRYFTYYSYVAGPVKINHVSTKNLPILSSLLY